MAPELKKSITAFKHPNCGGIILKIESQGEITFECDSCGQKSDDIDALILTRLVVIRSNHPNRKV